MGLDVTVLVLMNIFSSFFSKNARILHSQLRRNRGHGSGCRQKVDHSQNQERLLKHDQSFRALGFRVDVAETDGALNSEGEVDGIDEVGGLVQSVEMISAALRESVVQEREYDDRGQIECE